jgi:hypothetical protein
MHQFQGELDAAAGDFNSASKEFAQAIAVESPASRETAEAVRVRLELSQNLARAGKPEEALSVTRDAISVSKDLSDKRARLVAVRILASQLADQNIMAPGTYRAAYDAFAAAVAYDARFARTRADQVERNETLQITDSAAQVYYRVLLAQHKDAEARLLAQRIVELHQGRALPVPVLGK